MYLMTHKLVVPFRAHHYHWLTAAGAAAEGISPVVMTPEWLVQLEHTNAWTGVVDGAPIVCAGTIEQWPGRHIAWAYLVDETRPHMLWITREVLAQLEQVKGRVECTVRRDFEPGRRWARLLGFRPESILKKYGPEGEDHIGYVRGI